MDSKSSDCDDASVNERTTKSTRSTAEQRAFGARVRYLRLKAGHSQEELADLCELDRTYIGGIERGERNPSLKNILRIAGALGVSTALLFEQTGEGRS